VIQKKKLNSRLQHPIRGYTEGKEEGRRPRGRGGNGRNGNRILVTGHYERKQKEGSYSGMYFRAFVQEFYQERREKKNERKEGEKEEGETVKGTRRKGDARRNQKIP